MAKREKYGWGIWIVGERTWATLPPRMCKPTPHNCDLNYGLVDHMRKLEGEGREVELKRIPPRTLKYMRGQRA